MYTIATIALFASAVFAQIPGLPDCSQTCITDYGGCNQVDVKCICSNVPLLEKLSCCVSQKCDAKGQADVISFADSLCGSYGVTTLPTAAGCTGSAAGASSTASGSATMTMTGTMSMTSAPSTTSATSAHASASSMASTATKSAASAASSAASASKQSTAAAPTNAVQQVLGFGLGAAGLLAVL
ncbi:uncharacterized protein MYCFIDRAFT_86758 [Pseudocercospora fijiensis CIRAD86]|uniref:CFEM domain-containing protein n=1 Tax=Pseudocercospora fijiensis (strain CIRAD86) TaxID=383855 RepID=M2ZLY9_PSEFD|nr:uncharacterized protein MYCFIDRAFT_86758 [Pseudocercospora fijiensis CIRAD86]EME80084.1 hypothetical protein MYCFIDRAFT_86758 [Pseudocercospora fijiensis CIRAD86]